MRPEQRRAFDIALLVLTEATVFAVAFGLSNPYRGLLVLLAAVLVPGAAIAQRLPLEEPLTYAVLAVALSLAVCTVGAMAMVWSGLWYPRLFGAALALVSTVVLVWDVVRITREASPVEAHSWV
jgi:hypothetical protein